VARRRGGGTDLPPQPALADRPRLAVARVLPQRRRREEPPHAAARGPLVPAPVPRPDHRAAVGRRPARAARRPARPGACATSAGST
jgi:hypothetical protein